MPASRSALVERALRAQAEAAVQAASPIPVDFKALRRRELEQARLPSVSPFAVCLERRTSARRTSLS